MIVLITYVVWRMRNRSFRKISLLWGNWSSNTLSVMWRSLVWTTKDQTWIRCITLGRRSPVSNFIAVCWNYWRRKIWRATVSYIASSLCTSCKEHTTEWIASAVNYIELGPRKFLRAINSPLATRNKYVTLDLFLKTLWKWNMLVLYCLRHCRWILMLSTTRNWEV
jgi:hypothetical protein